MRSNSKHTAKELEMYIQFYINDGISYTKLCEKHGLLLAQSKFHDKVLRYQEHGLAGIQSSITNNRYSESLSYTEAAKKHDVSYNNIYSWVQKYKKHGPDGLVDGRGRRKPNTIQTDEEKLKTEIAALKARNEYLETENAALKKLKAVERELMLRK